MSKLSSCWDSNAQDRSASLLGPPDGECFFHYFSISVLGDVFLCQECKNSPAHSVKNVHDLLVQGTMLSQTARIYKYFFINPCLTFKKSELLLIISLQAVPKAVLYIGEMMVASHSVRSRISSPFGTDHHPLPLSVDRPTSHSLDLESTGNPSENSKPGNSTHTIYLWFIDYSGSVKYVHINNRRWLLRCISMVGNVLLIKTLQLEWLTQPPLIITSST